MDDNFGFEDIEVSGAKRPGRKSGAQTPAKPSERKKGSSKNKPGSAGKSGSAITFSAKVVDALKNKEKASLISEAESMIPDKFKNDEILPKFIIIRQEDS